MNGSGRLIVASGLAVTLIAAGCGSDSAGEAEGGNEQEFDCTIDIGGDTELSGFDQAFGQSQVDGVEVAVNDINNDGGVDLDNETCQLRIDPTDNRSEATGVVTSAREVAGEEPLAAIAPNNNFDAGYQILKGAGIITFGGNPSLALQLLTNAEENSQLFSVIPFSPTLFPNWLAQIKNLHPDIVRVGVLIEDDEIAEPLVGSIREVAGQLGMDVVAVETFAPGSTDFTTELTRIKEGNPDIVFTGRVPVHNIPASQQAAQLDVAPYIWNFTGIPSKLGNLSQFEGHTFIFSQFALTFGEGATLPELEQGARHMREVLDGDPLIPEIAIVDYNFTWLLKEAIEEAGTTEVEAVAEALVGQSYNGPFGPVTMDQGQFVDQRTSQIVWESGTTTVYVYETLTEPDAIDQVEIT